MSFAGKGRDQGNDVLHHLFFEGDRLSLLLRHDYLCREIGADGFQQLYPEPG